MVLNNRLECVVALLSRMADVELVDNSGNTALHLAARGKNPAIVQALIVFGANINAL
jgi:Ankyrin repeat.